MREEGGVKRGRKKGGGRTKDKWSLTLILRGILDAQDLSIVSLNLKHYVQELHVVHPVNPVERDREGPSSLLPFLVDTTLCSSASIPSLTSRCLLCLPWPAGALEDGISHTSLPSGCPPQHWRPLPETTPTSDTSTHTVSDAIPGYLLASFREERSELVYMILMRS